MSAAELGQMSLTNLVMLAGMVIGMKGAKLFLAPLERWTGLVRFRAIYGERFRAIDVERQALTTEALEAAEALPRVEDSFTDPFTALRERGRQLDADLRALVEEVIADSSVNPQGMRTALAESFRRVAQTPVPELLRELGLDPELPLEVTGNDQVVTYPPGRTQGLMAWLRSQGFEVSPEIETATGQRVFDTTIPGREPVRFTERVARLGTREEIHQRYFDRLPVINGNRAKIPAVDNLNWDPATRRYTFPEGPLRTRAQQVGGRDFVQFDEAGEADFSAFNHRDVPREGVTIPNFTSNRSTNFRQFRDAVRAVTLNPNWPPPPRSSDGYSPRGWTWHETRTGVGFLVPSELHVPEPSHSGGVSVQQQLGR